MERFFNGDMECVVLMRSGTVSLIAILNNAHTPFVVPLAHVQGSGEWWQGHHYSNLEDAINKFKEKTPAG